MKSSIKTSTKQKMLRFTDKPTIATTAIGFCGMFISIAGTTAAVTFGILALIPRAPFEEKYVGVGATLLVLSVTGVVGCAGYFLGCLAAGVVCAPCLWTKKLLGYSA